jgi:hypothetical protein
MSKESEIIVSLMSRVDDLEQRLNDLEDATKLLSASQGAIARSLEILFKTKEDQS